MNTTTQTEGVDELVLLARDARQRRRRTNITSTLAVTLAMGLSAGYVVSNNQSDNSTPTDQTPAGTPINTFSPIYSPSFSPMFETGSSSQEGEARSLVLQQNFAGEPGGGGVSQTTETTTVMRVYLLQGSRRVPVAVGDIVWIPEIRSQVTLRSVGPPAQVSFMPDNPEMPPRPGDGEPQNLPLARMIETTPDRGNTNCVVIRAYPSAQAPDTSFIDLDLDFLLLNTQMCVP